MIYGLDLRGKDVGGPVWPGRLVSLPGMETGTEADLRRETRVAFLVHGYNVNRPDGQRALRNLAADLTLSADIGLVAVTWPGDSWARFASYPLEGNDADDSGRELARFIDLVIPAGIELAFVSHSLGARVVMECLRRVPRDRNPVGQVCVMAPAIDDTSLADHRAYLRATCEAARVAVLASEKDRVLRFAYPLGDALQAFLFFRRDRAGRALGLSGPRGSGKEPVPPTVLHRQIPNARKVDHGDYLRSRTANSEHVSAALFVDSVLSGAATPEYP